MEDLTKISSPTARATFQARDQAQERGDGGPRDPEAAGRARHRARGVHADDVGGGLRRTLPPGDGQVVKGRNPFLVI